MLFVLTFASLLRQVLVFWAIQKTKTLIQNQGRQYTAVLESNLMNSSHHKIFKCIDFVPSHSVSVINLDVILSFSVFNEFDSCIVSLNQ